MLITPHTVAFVTFSRLIIPVISLKVQRFLTGRLLSTFVKDLKTISIISFDSPTEMFFSAQSEFSMK